MRVLIDTHLLLWAAGDPDRLPTAALTEIENPDNVLMFSAASIWEVTIKNGLGRSDFTVDSALLRRGLLDNGYEELPIRGQHAVFAGRLPRLHKDPFDRILVAQSLVEGAALLTSDELVAHYHQSIRLV
ncbi:MAG TPA: type II toxin-antitoxin system VapC family toxin [Ramlibacter sp.]|jgi:PIN domain nuclease of toxin-antitoxin system